MRPECEIENGMSAEGLLFTRVSHKEQSSRSSLNAISRRTSSRAANPNHDQRFAGRGTKHAWALGGVMKLVEIFRRFLLWPRSGALRSTRTGFEFAAL